MKPLIWRQKKLRFQNVALDTWVARSPKDELLEREVETLGPTLPVDITLILRQPSAPFFRAPLPDKELWKIPGLGSFDSIRFAKTVFSSPDDECFLEGADSLEAIIAMLSEAFVEGEFKLAWVSPNELLFRSTKPNAKVTRKQHALLEILNTRFFGCSAKAVDYCPPRGFSIGSCM